MLSVLQMEGDFGTDKHGLIYTDEKFLKQFRTVLQTDYGFSRKEVLDLDYTEQGMQEDNYVSLCGGKAFITGWRRFQKSQKQQ